MLRAAAAIGGLVFISAMVLRFGRFTVSQPRVEVPQVQLNAIEERIVELVNAARAQVGAAPLALSDRLTLAARAHAQDMAAHGYLAHDSAAGDPPADRVRSVGLDYDELAENLLSDPGHEVDALPQRAIAAWLASPTPRNNLLSPRFRTAAVAIAHATNGSFYVTLDLMR
jgi:uncharacterized protein YkwD